MSECTHQVITLRHRPGRSYEQDWWECLMPECDVVDHDVTEVFGKALSRDYGYAPLDCLTCGRHRLIYFVTDKRVIIYCEKCGAREWDCAETVHELTGGPHPQKASAWVQGMGVG